MLADLPAPGLFLRRRGMKFYSGALSPLLFRAPFSLYERGGFCSRAYAAFSSSFLPAIESPWKGEALFFLSQPICPCLPPSNGRNSSRHPDPLSPLFFKSREQFFSSPRQVHVFFLPSFSKTFPFSLCCEGISEGDLERARLAFPPSLLFSAPCEGLHCPLLSSGEVCQFKGREKEDRGNPFYLHKYEYETFFSVRTGYTSASFFYFFLIVQLPSFPLLGISTRNDVVPRQLLLLFRSSLLALWENFFP